MALDSAPSIPIPPSTTATTTTTARSTTLPPSSTQQQPILAKPKQDKHSASYIIRSLVAGGVAGCAAKTSIAPLDRVKILFQTNNPQFQKHSGHFFGVFRAASEISKAHGLRGLFQGHSATLLRIFPYAAIKFMAYEQYKDLLMPTKKDETSIKRFVAGSLAGVTSVFFTYPLDILRTRLAFEVRSSTSKIGILSTTATMLREPHPYGLGIFNLYRGFLPTIYGMIPYAGVSFLTYESMKIWAAKQKGWTTDEGKKGQLRWWAQLFVGGFSGALAQTASYPFEVIRRRMQVAGKVAMKGVSEQAARYPGTWQTAVWIYQTRGFSGFFVGLSIGYLKITPMFAVSFFVYEHMKAVFQIE
ncbi:hypothetical protein HDU97_004878 [Phlyctochytrium planicorne]|nr:hypothetical protein HDU97_004878 [Phlyctochytrium planicorne]